MSINLHRRSSARALVTMIASVIMAAYLSTPLYAQSNIPSEILKLVAEGDTGVPLFGISVDVDGDTAVIGAADDDGQGAAYIFLREDEQWNQQARITATRRFGESVAIDGDTMLVGAPFAAGRVFVFTRDHEGNWVFKAVLVGDSPATINAFGASVALHEGTAVVGARNEAQTGAAYVFVSDDGANWTRQAKLLGAGNQFDRFGASVAISGDTIIVGDFENDDKDPQAGAAFVFTRSGGSWTRTANLLPQGPYAGFVHFGTSVAIDGDVVVVGAPRDRQIGDFSGAAYVFTRQSGDWSVTAKLLSPEGGPHGEFGSSVDVAGGTILVGEPSRASLVTDDRIFRTGAAYLFSYDGGSWSEGTQVLPGDISPGDRFGTAVATDGSTSLVGAPGDDELGTDSGAAYVISGSSGVFGLHCPRDLNGEGPVELVVVSPDGRVQVKDMNGAEVAAFDITGFGRVVASRVLPDRNGNGVPELVVLTEGPTRIEILDLHTGDRLAQSEELTQTLIGIPFDLELLGETGGIWAGAAVTLGASPSRAMMRNTIAMNRINLAGFDDYVQPTDLAIYPDLDGDGVPDFAVLGENRESWGSDKIELRGSLSGLKLFDIWLGSGWEVLQHELVSDVNGNAMPEAAVLRVSDARDQVTVLLRDIGSKQWLGTMYFDPNYPPIRLLALPDITGNGADEVVVFGQRFNGGNQKAQLIDSATGAFAGVIFYSRNFDGIDLVRCDDMNGNGADELAMLGRRKSDGLYRVIVKDARTGERLANVNFR